MNHQVAVVTRTHNRPQLLRRALLSAAAQSFTSFLHIVVNDAGSEEKVSQVLDSLDPHARSRIFRIDNKISSGREAAVNPGFKAALEFGCRYIVVLDDDDTWSPDFLSKTVAYLDSHPDEVAVASAVNVVMEQIENDEIKTLGSERLAADKNQILLSDIMVKNFIPPVCLLFRASVLDALHGWDGSLPVLADWDFLLRLSVQGPIGFINEVLAYWHHRSSKDENLGNSIVVAAAEHSAYEGIIRDRFLRAFVNARGENELASLLVEAGYVSRLLGALEETRKSQSQHLESVKGFITERLYLYEQRLEELERRLCDLDRHLALIGTQNEILISKLREFD